MILMLLDLRQELDVTKKKKDDTDSPLAPAVGKVKPEIKVEPSIAVPPSTLDNIKEEQIAATPVRQNSLKCKLS